MVRVSINIYGQVQGVFFRQSAKQEAEKLGIVGFVKNNVDGSVGIEAEGDEKVLKEFISWCKKGPTSANVKKVEVKWGKTTKDYETFEIVRD